MVLRAQRVLKGLKVLVLVVPKVLVLVVPKVRRAPLAPFAPLALAPFAPLAPLAPSAPTPIYCKLSSLMTTVFLPTSFPSTVIVTR